MPVKAAAPAGTRPKGGLAVNRPRTKPGDRPRRQAGGALRFLTRAGHNPPQTPALTRFRRQDIADVYDIADDIADENSDPYIFDIEAYVFCVLT